MPQAAERWTTAKSDGLQAPDYVDFASLNSATFFQKTPFIVRSRGSELL